jgi:hypothetical protein
MGWTCGTCRIGSAYRVLVGKPESRRQRGRPWRRREGINRVGLKIESMALTGLSWPRIRTCRAGVYTVMNILFA